MNSPEVTTSILSAIIVFVVVALILFVAGLIPYLLNAIGLARVCKKLSACSPVFAFIPILNYYAIAKAADAGDRYNGIERKRKITKHMMISTVMCVLSSVILIALAVPTSILMTSLDPAMQLISTVLMLAYLVWMFVTYAIFLWRTVVCVICYWRMFSPFSQVLSIVMLVVALIAPNFCCVVMFIAPFFKLKEVEPKYEEYRDPYFS